VSGTGNSLNGYQIQIFPPSRQTNMTFKWVIFHAYTTAKKNVAFCDMLVVLLTMRENTIIRMPQHAIKIYHNRMHYTMEFFFQSIHILQGWSLAGFLKEPTVSRYS
jgi:hypothetical protein